MNNALETIKIDSTLSSEELETIKGLNFASFEGAKDENAFKNGLKETKIQIDGVEGGMTFLEIAEKFDEYVEKGDGWKLQKKEGKEAIPGRITNIVENPKNNDLAFLVQKIAEIIEYQTAKKYTDDQLDVVMVGVDKTFGNQTRRALKGLKERILSNDEEDSRNKKFVSRQRLEGEINGKGIEEIKGILDPYNLEYVDGKIQPKNDYELIDPYSSNLATKTKVEIIAANEVVIAGNSSSNTNGSSVLETKEFLHTKEFSEVVLQEITTLSNNEQVAYFGNTYPVTFRIGVSKNKEKSNAYGAGYDSISLYSNGGSVLIPMESIVDENNNFDKIKRKTQILPQQKEKLKENILAKALTKELRDKRITEAEIFQNMDKDELITDYQKATIKQYVGSFYEKQIWIDKYHTYSEDGIIYLNLNDTKKESSFKKTKDFNKSENNTLLHVSARDISDDDGNLDEKKFIKKLVDIIIKTVESNSI